MGNLLGWTLLGSPGASLLEACHSRRHIAAFSGSLRRCGESLVGGLVSGQYQTRHPARYDPSKSNRASADSRFVWGNAEQCLALFYTLACLAAARPPLGLAVSLRRGQSRLSRISPCVPPASFLPGGKRVLATPFPVSGERDRRLAAPLQRSQPLYPGHGEFRSHRSIPHPHLWLSRPVRDGRLLKACEALESRAAGHTHDTDPCFGCRRAGPIATLFPRARVADDACCSPFPCLPW